MRIGRAVVGWVAGLLLLGGFGCEATPDSPGTIAKPKTTIQHDAPAPGQDAPAGKQLPPGHPSLDGSSDDSLPPGHPPLDGSGNGGSLPPGHPPIGDAEPLDSKALLAKVEAMKAQLKDKPKTLEVVLALGSLYYDNQKYLDAVDYYREAIAVGQPYVDYDLKLHKELGALAPAKLTDAGCDRSQLHDSEQLFARAQQLHSRKKEAMALACADEAAAPVVTAHTRRGNALYLVGNALGAVAEHEKAIALDPTATDSLFFRGAILFDSMGDDVPRLKQAKQSWEQFLKVAPDSPRAAAIKDMMPQLDQAIALGGVSKLPKPAMPPGHPGAAGEDDESDEGPGAGGGPVAPPLDPGAAEAIQNADLDADTIAGMGKVLDQATAAIAKGDLTGAVTQLKSVFPFTMAQPDKFTPAFRARAATLMSLYMGSKGAPMAAPLLGQAVAGSPEAVDQVAFALAKAGDTAHAKQLWAALRSANPDYAKQAKLDDKLAR